MNSWEKAVRVTPSNKKTGDTLTDAMHKRQREIAQEGWESDIDKAKAAREAREPRDASDELTAQGWAKMYTAGEEYQEEIPRIELTPIEQIIKVLEDAQVFNKEQGAVGSVKMLIEKNRILDQQLQTIRSSLGL